MGRSTGEGLGYPLQYSWASLVAQLVKNLPAMRETWVRSLGWEDPLEKGRLPTPVFQPGEFHGLYSVAESDTTERLSNAGDAGSIPWLGRSPGERKGYPRQYSDLENSMDCIVHGVTKSRTRLRDFHFHLLSGRLLLISQPCGRSQAGVVSATLQKRAQWTGHPLGLT